MKKILILLCFILCMTVVCTMFANATDSTAEINSSSAAVSTSIPETTPYSTPEVSKGPVKATAEPIPNNKGDIQVLDPGNTDAPVNSTGKIILIAAIVLVCLFFVIEGFVSIFIKKK